MGGGRRAPPPPPKPRSSPPSPPPSPPTAPAPHLPLDGGGWEGVEPRAHGPALPRPKRRSPAPLWTIAPYDSKQTPEHPPVSHEFLPCCLKAPISSVPSTARQ